MASKASRQHKAKERALTLQEREMHRYYQPWLDAQGSSANVASHVQNLDDDFTVDTLSEKGFNAQASQDTTLTAFAQLAALRLNVRRAMVSMIDSTHQYILTEATRTLSLVDHTRHGPDDALWLGSARVARNDALCECAFTRTYTVLNDQGVALTANAAVIPDCRLDAEFNNRPYITDETIRFYAGVPIKSRSGHKIGVYAVSHDQPRDPLTYDELRFMQDIAVAVMNHLEWARDRVDRYKGERIVRGMADFIEGAPSMRVMKKESDADNQHTTAAPEVKSGSDLQTRLKDDSPKRPPTKRTETNKSAGRPTLESRSESFVRRREAKADNISRLFDRASRIMKESTLAEGVVFFGPSGTNPAKQTLRSAMLARDKTSSGTDDESAKHLSVDSADVENSTDSDTGHQMRTTKILGLSLTNNKDSSLFHNAALDVLTLENYFKLYPNGKSLHFSEAGSGLSSEDDSASESQRSANDNSKTATETTSQKVIGKKKKIRMSHQELLKNLPGVKNVIFLPLWDYVEEKMVAGCFLWTSNTGRMMNLDDDLTYLRAFGNTIMSEVARMNALKDDRAKTTFIASMSHELRSPLHGILGSVEFLQDTAADAYQAGLINSISTCGKTLLDTLDHVLDYAKINKLGRNRMKKDAKANRLASATDSPSESLSISADIDLGLVVEEVVEAVCAGHAFKKMHNRELKSRDGPVMTLSRHASASATATADGANIMDGEVAVLLDVSPRASWMVRTQPGALRRIIMNLLGNALKYTPRGWVAVSLRAQESSHPNKIDVVFRVIDSGKGMSEDFQKNRLFVPFSQEDTFQPGTGLGLSIVRQIVDSLGGTIEVKSEQNVGTEIDVRMSLSTPETAPDNIPDDEIAAVTAKTKGLRLCLLDPNGEKQRDHNDHISRLDTTLSEVCWGWFEMEVTKADNLKDVDADVYLYTEPPTVEFLLEHHSVNKTGSAGGRGKEVPLIIVCLNASEALDITANHIKTLSDLGRIVEVVSQPCGPRKLAKVLSQCITRMEETFNRPMKPDRQPQGLPHRSRLEDMGAASVLGLPSMTLPRLNTSEENAESTRAREFIRNTALEVPPSTAVAFPNIDRDAGSARALQDQPHTEQAPHVLLVDDNPINLQLLVMFMKKHKLPYQEATNGQEALDKYIEYGSGAPDKRPFDFVLMDISMPVMNGLDSTRGIRAFEIEHGIEKKATVIALTGLASAEAQADAESSGVNIFMAKPVKFQALRPLLVSKSPEKKVEEQKAS
ncbi:hypothetical protein AUEXF2481DRAFT_102158 [Aureobasidium subglaciale EXF-2481]|uniref:histidine kinase n=1 Tax=Aureobasidium subglaciale (strain EXF-2481) TaxID=1043005 RepID=A0A074XZQ4_AURSE|nr:uncharacterized protein AUEXF2481DRAFT_102158 [Aureobasidium subglaciale EXF-2481]KAI5202514.1 hypothetical protein E4T38_05631 [Aureobasidium subglaciale]KAI5221306.1 hypothetical protein E4T40_05564 [Aureobasidium subglaciale]KAI5225196.1 hypothetical protein E4T41_05383 [Aureobasidium subglaciale]KAI5261357.1 hypothetical protein E4T46_05193 [Aureobasidium subglaciale]KEQ91033.1 hypothetical protein AUEXF2481DRAFT_102158 [Aureobasidium subglaciale EXF-2481]